MSHEGVYYASLPPDGANGEVTSAASGETWAKSLRSAGRSSSSSESAQESPHHNEHRTVTSAVKPSRRASAEHLPLMEPFVYPRAAPGQGRRAVDYVRGHLHAQGGAGSSSSANGKSVPGSGKAKRRASLPFEAKHQPPVLPSSTIKAASSALVGTPVPVYADDLSIARVILFQPQQEVDASTRREHDDAVEHVLESDMHPPPHNEQEQETQIPLPPQDEEKGQDAEPQLAAQREEQEVEPHVTAQDEDHVQEADRQPPARDEGPEQQDGVQLQLAAQDEARERVEAPPVQSQLGPADTELSSQASVALPSVATDNATASDVGHFPHGTEQGVGLQPQKRTKGKQHAAARAVSEPSLMPVIIPLLILALLFTLRSLVVASPSPGIPSSMGVGIDGGGMSPGRTVGTVTPAPTTWMSGNNRQDGVPSPSVAAVLQAEEEAKAKAKAEEEAKAKAKAEEEAKAKAKAEEEAKAKAKAEEQAKAKAKAKAEEEAKAKAKAEEEGNAKAKAEEEAKAKAKAEEEAKAKAKAEEEAKAKAKAEAKAKAKAEEEAKAKEKAKAEEEAKAQSAASFPSGGAALLLLSFLLASIAAVIMRLWYGTAEVSRRQPGMHASMEGQSQSLPPSPSIAVSGGPRGARRQEATHVVEPQDGGAVQGTPQSTGRKRGARSRTPGSAKPMGEPATPAQPAAGTARRSRSRSRSRARK